MRLLNGNSCWAEILLAWPPPLLMRLIFRIRLSLTAGGLFLLKWGSPGTIWIHFDTNSSNCDLIDHVKWIIMWRSSAYSVYTPSSKKSPKFLLTKSQRLIGSPLNSLSLQFLLLSIWFTFRFYLHNSILIIKVKVGLPLPHRGELWNASEIPSCKKVGV